MLRLPPSHELDDVSRTRQCLCSLELMRPYVNIRWDDHPPTSSTSRYVPPSLVHAPTLSGESHKIAERFPADARAISGRVRIWAQPESGRARRCEERDFSTTALRASARNDKNASAAALSCHFDWSERSGPPPVISTGASAASGMEKSRHPPGKRLRAYTSEA